MTAPHGPAEATITHAAVNSRAKVISKGGAIGRVAPTDRVATLKAANETAAAVSPANSAQQLHRNAAAVLTPHAK